MAINSQTLMKIKSIEWIVLSSILTIYALYIGLKISWRGAFTLFNYLLILIFVICFLTIIFALADLKVIYHYTNDVTQDPLWFRVTWGFCEFGIWYGVYLTTFLVSYTYFMASLQLRHELKNANMLEPEKANSYLMRLSSVAYLRIFFLCAFLIGLLTLVHSVLLVYMFYHFKQA